VRSLEGGEQVRACLLAAAAGLSADAAVLVHVGMAFALLAHALQAAAQASRTARVTLTSYAVRRDSALLVARQISAQSRLVRMHVVRSDTMSSDRQASAQAVQTCEHSTQAAMQSTSSFLSMPPRSFGYNSSICV
jgi:hypothetical protein